MYTHIHTNAHIYTHTNQSKMQFCNIIILQGGSKVAWAIPKLPP